MDDKIWTELQRQLSRKGYIVKQGVIQDASFIEADLGRIHHYKEKRARKKEEKISIQRKKRRHMDHKGSFSIKQGQLHYGYKSHIKLDVDNHLISPYHMSTAALHDGEVELFSPADMVAYREKEYFGKPLPVRVKDKTMRRATKNRKLNGSQQKRNKLIAKNTREMAFSVIKLVSRGLAYI